MHIIMILPLVLYGYATWSLAFREDRGLGMGFEFLTTLNAKLSEVRYSNLPFD